MPEDSTTVTDLHKIGQFEAKEGPVVNSSKQLMGARLAV